MFRRSEIAPAEVHATLRRHMLVDGYPIVVDMENSRRSWVRDLVTGKDYLDFFSFFASNPIGFNHPSMLDDETQQRLARVGTTKVSNADYYTTYMAEFVDTLSRSAAPADLPHFFFVDGGALGVENAMKTAFDWKVKKNLGAGKAARGQQVLHLESAFHGRSGYTLSVTNTDPVKTQYFPQFDWPRIPCPAIRFPLEAENLDRVVEAERRAVAAAERAFDERPDDIAAILVEPIQGEGGDNHFRAEFLRDLRRLADERQALLIFDEVQTGLGLTGKWWAYEHFGVTPDILCFAKKMQVGGLFASRRVDEVPDNVFVTPSRINSTWGASLSDMVRCTRILEIIVNENLIENAAVRGAELTRGLERIRDRFAGVIDNPRGRGLMCAIDLPSKELRNKVVRRCFEDGMIVLPCGTHSIRFRPTLTVTADAIAEGVDRLERAIGEVLSGVAGRPA
jgi:L-lysine 6-transaminase